VVYVAA